MEPERGGRVRAFTVDIAPLRESPAYRALWGGQIISLIGTHMRVVAVPFQVFALTESSAAVGLVGLMEVVPLILLAILGGVLLDVFDRRRIMAIAQLLLAANSVVLAILTLSGRASLIWIYSLVAIAAGLSAVDQPARASMTPSLVRAELIPAAVALRQVVHQITLIVGPALGGLLIAALGGNVGYLYLIDGATFVLALVFLRWVPPVKPSGDLDDGSPPRPTPSAVKEGLSYAFRNRLILSIFLIDLVAMVFGMPRAVFPALAAGTFDVGAAGLGLLYGAPAIGALIGALTTGWVSGVRRRGLAVISAVACWGAAITLAGVSLFSFPLTLFWLALAGTADVISAVFRGTMLLAATPGPLLGRISALNLMVVTGGPRLGDVEAGLVAQAFGPGPSIIVGGVACLLGTAAVGGGFRALRDHQSEAAKPVSRT